MCKDMKKNPNSPPNRLPNSPHPLKKVKKSTSQQVNEFWGLKSLLWVCLGLLWVRRGCYRGAKHRFNPLKSDFIIKNSEICWLLFDSTFNGRFFPNRSNVE